MKSITRLTRKAILVGAVGASVLLTQITPAVASAATPTASNAAAAKVAARSSFYVDAASPYSNILSLQYLLNAYGFGTPTTGSYDAATTASVKRFQAAKKLTQDGSAGPITMHAMLGGSNVAVKQGWPNANTVKAAQRQLVKIGYQVAVNGTFDSTDTADVKYVQTKYKIAATGTVDYVTWTYLFNPPPRPALRQRG